MKYLKNYKIFELNNFDADFDDDDSDVMARYQIFSGECFISFYFRDILIKNKEEISNLISIYNKLSKKDNEWSGGPVSRSFDDYFIKKYKPILGDVINFKLNNPWKPQIGLTFKTEYGFLQSGFSLKNKKMSSLYSGFFDISHEPVFEKQIINLKELKTTQSRYDTYDGKVKSEMFRLLKKYWKSDLYDLIFDMNLNVNFDWSWED